MGQLPLLPLMDKRQRSRHFARREKVLGQFFTSPALAAWVVEIATSMLTSFHSALDPACGDGVFLRQMLQHNFETVVGIDVDAAVLKVCAQQLNDEKRLHLRCSDALWLLNELSERFDLVATNPPFSAKYGRVSEPSLLRRFELGHGRSSEAIESLFLELCVRSLRPNGVLAIVLPEGIFANLTQERVRQWLCRHATPLAIVSLSRAFFAAKSCVLFARKQPANPDNLVLLAHAENETDLANIAQQIRCQSGLLKPVKELLNDMSPLHHLNVPKLRSVFPLLPLKALLWDMRSGSTEYGAKRQFTDHGIPFISAKTVTPFGIDLRRDGRFVAKGSPMDKPQARTKVGDVVFVRVGVGCIGRAAAVLHDDETGVADDYLYILRFRTDLLLPEFFALFAQTRMFQQQLERIKRGTGTVTVPQRLLHEMLVPVPPMDVQQQFAIAYRQLHACYRNAVAKPEELTSLVAQLERTLKGETVEANFVESRLVGLRSCLKQ